ncbi:integrase core domain-containing protein [Rhodococcus olei]|uniref:integrase core domain-containing protein n=1 Tax=Rhodococcus olei TaxID=2161675 RepID=UPI003CD0B2FC
MSQLSSRPRHPQACGKLERYHRTFTEFYADRGPAHDIDELQRLCDAFRWEYNHERPHRSLNQQTPANVHRDLPKVAPGDEPPPDGTADPAGVQGGVGQLPQTQDRCRTGIYRATGHRHPVR